MALNDGAPGGGNGRYGVGGAEQPLSIDARFPFPPRGGVESKGQGARGGRPAIPFVPVFDALGAKGCLEANYRMSKARPSCGENLRFSVGVDWELSFRGIDSSFCVEMNLFYLNLKSTKINSERIVRKAYI